MKRVVRPARAAKVAVLVALVAITATGCNVPEALYFGWPEGITDDAETMRIFWTWVVIAALIVGVIVWGLIVWSVIFHRKGRADKRDAKRRGTSPESTGSTGSAGPVGGASAAYDSDDLPTTAESAAAMPRQFQYNVRLEIFCVVVPIIMVLVLFFFTVMTGQKVMAHEKKPALTVDVVAFQWNWEFRYPDAPKTPEGGTVSTVGTSNRIPLLVVPTNREVKYELHSTDVIHSFWVVAFNFKRDVMPFPHKNNQDNTYQTTIEETGAYVGRCAELCGTYHSAMNFELRALPPKKFDHYMELRTKVDPSTGELYTAPGALARMQEQGCGDLCSPTAVTTHPFVTKRTEDSAVR